MKHGDSRWGPEGGRISPRVESLIRHALGGGERLKEAVARPLGAGLGIDLGDVRVHADSCADRLTRHLGARAFTVGADIFFRHDTYDPDAPAGRRLIAHELAHVIQQGDGRVPSLDAGMTVRPVGDVFDREADALSELVASGMRQMPGRVNSCRLLPLGSRDGRPLVIQRDAAAMVRNANRRPPARVAPRNYGPATCNEAALGWLLRSAGYTHPWQLMRQVGNSLLLPRCIGNWLGEHVYHPRTRVRRVHLVGGHPAARPGDILCILQGGSPMVWHSMVVVSTTPGGPVNIRGFNNAGTFNHVGIVAPAPPGQYDNRDRDATEPAIWHGHGHTMGAVAPGGAVYLVRYQDAVNSLRTALEHWTYSFFDTPGWQHRRGRPCRPHCP